MNLRRPWVTATGRGNVLTGEGISVAVTGLNPSDLAGATTVSGDVGSVTAVDNSPTFQTGPNAGQTASVSIDAVRSADLGRGVAGSQFASLAAIAVTTAAEATDALGVIDQAVSEVSQLQARLGAFQEQTLQAGGQALQGQLENTVLAESVIRDTDMATESANFSQGQVLVQAGATLLQAANVTSQIVLQLLRG